MATKPLTATYDQDSKRYHRYIIDDGQGIVGNIYIPKADEVPEQVTITLQLPQDREASAR